MPAIERVELAPGYMISRLIKGTWQLFAGPKQIPERQALADMAAFAEAGIDTFETSDTYPGVEALTGRFLQPANIHTRITLRRADRVDIGARIAASCERLRRDRLDLVQLAWPDLESPGLVEAAQILAGLPTVARLGTTNLGVAQLRAIVDGGVKLVSSQNQYSLLDDRPARQLTAFCRGHGIALLGYGPLAGGFLTDGRLGQADPGDEGHPEYRAIIELFGGWDLHQELLAALTAIAKRHGVTLANVAARWVLEQPQVAAILVGASGPYHLADNARVFGFALDDRDRALLAPVLARRQGPTGDVGVLERDPVSTLGRAIASRRMV